MTDAYGHYDAADFGLHVSADQPTPAKRECDALCRDIEQDRDRLAALVLHAAAECHRGKWAFEDGPAFDALHRIGEMLRPAALADRSPSPRRRQEAAIVRARRRCPFCCAADDGRRIKVLDGTYAHHLTGAGGECSGSGKSLVELPPLA